MKKIAETVLKSRAIRLPAYHAFNKWQYLLGSRGGQGPLYDVTTSAWRKFVTLLPKRNGIVLGDPNAQSDLSFPEDTCGFVTDVKAAKLLYFDEVVAEAQKLVAARDLKKEFAEKTGKLMDYRVTLHPTATQPNSPNSVFTKFALQPQIVGMARKYLGVTPRLRHTDISYDIPTPGPSTETQLWHRDPGDWISFGVFMYLTDVNPDNGPFTYIPKNLSTRVYGQVGKFRRFATKSRIQDHEMEEYVPKEHWKQVLGPKGTVAFCDSVSCYHRGLKPATGHRILYGAFFISPFGREEWNMKWHKEWDSRD